MASPKEAGGQKGGNHRPPVRTVEERNALVLQWQYLPDYVIDRRMSASRAVFNLGRDDAVQVAFVALLRAADLWDPSRGVKFVTYAVRSITNHVSRIGLSDSLVRIPVHVHAASPSLCPVKFDRVEDHDIPDRQPREDPFDPEDYERVGWALSELEPAYREVVQKRLLEGKIFREIGREVGVSKQAAQQLYKQGMGQLKLILSYQGEDHEPSSRRPVCR